MIAGEKREVIRITGCAIDAADIGGRYSGY